jgi:hypothetical protein
MKCSGPKFVITCAWVFLTTCPTFAQNDLRVADEGGFVAVLSGDRLVMRYKYEGVPYKPYVEQLCTPGGVNILRDSPADHKHHHGLMFAVTVNDVNFWEEQTAPGQQLHMRFKGIGVENIGGLALRAAWLGEDLNWVGPTGTIPVVVEERYVWVLVEPTLGATLLTWASHFGRVEGAAEPVPAEIVLTGTKYHGLGLRFLESMDQGGRFFNANGGAGVEGTNDKRSNWCAYTATADGHVVTVAVFDAPDNPRHPATWFTMDSPFAYLSATLDLNREPFPIGHAPTGLKYGVAVWDGEQAADAVEKAYRHWIVLEKESR